MATFTADKAKSGVLARFLHEGVVHELAAYSASVTMSAGDVIQMIKVPKGATIHDLWMNTSTPNSGATLDSIFSVGDGLDQSRYLSAGIASSKSILRATYAAGLGYQYSAADTLDITYVTITSEDTASMVLNLSVIYSCAIEKDKGLAGGTTAGG